MASRRGRTCVGGVQEVSVISRLGGLNPLMGARSQESTSDNHRLDIWADSICGLAIAAPARLFPNRSLLCDAAASSPTAHSCHVTHSQYMHYSLLIVLSRPARLAPPIWTLIPELPYPVILSISTCFHLTTKSSRRGGCSHLISG